jgi:hypothetical protein
MSRLDFSEVQNLSVAICQDRSFQTAGNSAKFRVDNVAVSSFLVTRHYRLALIGAASISHARTGRIHITFFNDKAPGGIGNLFFRARRYRLRVSGVNTTSIEVKKVELDGNALNMRNARDIVATYRAAESGTTVVSGAKIARLQNSYGVVLELHATKIGTSALDLAGMEINSYDWRAD